MIFRMSRSLCNLVPGLCVLMLLSGCTAWVMPGPVEKIQPTSTTKRVGKIVVLRGFIGVWSFGMDELCDKLKADGYDADVYQHDQWPWIARQITQTYRNAPNPEPLVMIGHSYGVDHGIRIARELAKSNIKVDLLIFIDPVTPPRVPGNVVRTMNYYQSRGWTDNLPWWRGIPLEKEPGAAGALHNLNLATDRRDLLEKNTNHSNIDENVKLQREILQLVAKACPVRSERRAGRSSR